VNRRRARRIGWVAITVSATLAAPGPPGPDGAPSPEARVLELLAGATPAYGVVDVEVTLYVGRKAIDARLMRARCVPTSPSKAG